MRSISKYQSGVNGDKFITDDVIAKGRYHKKDFSNNKQIARLNMDYGLYTFKLISGERLLKITSML